VEPALCLVVDDEEPARYLMRRLLEEEGCDVIEASTGRDALQLIRTEHPEIVFLDLLMPDMLGFEVAAHILGDRSLDSVNMVMVTSKILSEEEHEQLVKLRVPLVPKQSLTKGVVRAVLSNRRTTVGESSTLGRSIRR
jgi:CheY-like chemotaxis protein